MFDALFGAQDGLSSPEERQQTGRLLPWVGQVVVEGLDHNSAQRHYGRRDRDPVTEASTVDLVTQVAEVVARRLLGASPRE
ncbi:MAG: hypothetical protein ACO3JL_03290 [Myxococcota bacterium]